jgi:SAM-dependent methyltransferase
MAETESRLFAIPDQADLWDRQHARRGSVGPEATTLRDMPNEGARLFASYLTRPSSVLEIGPGNGRDARFLAQLGHHVICADISSVALQQLMAIAEEQNLTHLLTPILHDVSSGELPDHEQEFNGFYARSALHIDDRTMTIFAEKLDERLADGAMICIEGKSPNDPKISRSVQVGHGLALDQWENGHLRRIWTPEFMEQMCLENSWEIVDLQEYSEAIGHTSAVFNRLIARKQG